MSKKFISLVLALMLAVSMMTVAAMSVSAETDGSAQVSGDDTNTYYFYLPSNSSWVNSESQGKVGYYYWGGGNSPAWPGTEATATDVANVFSADVPSNMTSLIWNNFVDGGDDVTLDIHGKAAQTVDLGLEGYEDGDSAYYGEMNGFDGMIYVLKAKADSVDEGGQSKWSGEWFYYYGNGEYGTAKTKSALTDDDYYGKDGAFPTKIGQVATTEADVTSATNTSAAASAYLKVNSVSNYFPAAEAEYDESTNQVTVTYTFSADKAVLAADWTLTYDSSVLELATDEDGNALNTLASVSPVMAAKSGASLSIAEVGEDGYGSVSLTASDLSLYDFTSDNNVFAKLVFDVVTDKSTETTVDMSVDSLIVSSLGGDGTSDSDEEVALVSDKVVSTDNMAVAANAVSSVKFSRAVSGNLPLMLTVTADSNYFTPSTTAYYNETTQQITVTYEFKSDKKVLNTQWYLEYDPDILTVATTDADSVCPTMASSGTYEVNLSDKANGKGYVRLAASDLALYDFTETSTFATVTFDVNDISDIAPVETKISLQVESLVVSEVGDDNKTDNSKEITLVKNYEVMTDDAAASVSAVHGAPILTASSYIPDAAETTGEETTAQTTATAATEPTTTATESTTVSATSPTGSAASSTDDEATADSASSTTTTTNSAAVQTGDASLALVILGLLVGATCVMFVLRKKENIL